MKTTWLDFYSGGVPSFEYFLLQVKDVEEIASTSKVKSGIDITAELCLIGLAAYFEAYCKNEFAAVINICPEILKAFTLKRDCMVPARNLLHIVSAPRHRLGFLIAEEYDFGSAKTINSLFQDLLKITPFTKTEAKKYAQFLNDRNLLVHHGGTYTFRYAGQKFAKGDLRTYVHYHSLVVNKDDVRCWSKFLVAIATKTATATMRALLNFVSSEQIKCSAERKKAIGALGPLSVPPST